VSFEFQYHDVMAGDPPGLRERKKARTRAELQRHALRLFRDRGYAATTVDDIAAAADVSRSTFFRYFPTKDDVVLFDDVDPLLEAEFAAQPPGTPFLTAVRRAIRDAFASLTPEKRALEEVRMELARTVPELEAAARTRSPFMVHAIADRVAGAIGRDPSDVEVAALAGVVVGTRLAAQSLVDRDHGRSYIDALDAVLEALEDGRIPLATSPLGGVST
jgi:AcrR family transcriptional regulator